MDPDSHSITFNIPYDLSPDGWRSLVEVYKAMPGWVEGSGRDGCPTWWPNGSTAGFIGASVEPSGLLITGDVSLLTWQLWISEFVQRATAVLGFRVHDAAD